MIFNLHGSDGPLTEEVQAAEQLLLLHRRQLRGEIKVLNTAIRQRATSPDTLLWSAAAGFIIGELTRKRSSRANKHEHSDAAAADEPAPPGVLQLLLRYIAIARPIMTSAASFLAPFLHRMGEQAANADAMQATDESADAARVPPIEESA
ncbi:MAG: hypothetical protein JWN23_2275 [Rhodocyclales bacterium]|nr:hypothetical protein [Rhodocyclales bacterium]